MNNIPSKVSATDETYGMGMGIVDSGQGYIQQQRFDGTAHAYDLLLQPSGGNVVVDLIRWIIIMINWRPLVRLYLKVMK
ncbi:hypothetical protein EJ377_16240 [Chryseobacterium arthrosphaerae]|uniref:Uncharacterized protein n=1 Tax=Chryseobacterium arthrosphaerae TaxID=651561 RepID=A0A432DSF9_9FLAO|nr:hypothetical protein EJ377_16240 [Chryseobacterium arthrosphaerae]